MSQPGAASADIPQAVVDAAIDWAIKIRFGSPDEAARAALADWLAAAPVHELAWRRVQHMFQAMSEVPAAIANDVLQTTMTRRLRDRAGRRRTMRRIAVFCGAAPLGLWAAREYTPWQRLTADYSTGVGARKNVRLADGTVVDLNTDTAIRVRFSAGGRAVSLLRGEVFIATGADAASPVHRPFRVDTPNGAAQALGTRFGVRVDGDRTRVYVREGAVRLVAAGSREALVLRAGEAGWIGPDDATGHWASATMDPAAWTEDAVSVKGMRLADLLAEIARYRPGFITCDPAVADRRVSGTYHILDTDAALRFLASTQSLKVTYRTRYWVVVGPKDTAV